MEKDKKARTPLRASLTKTIKEVEAELAKRECNRVILRLKLDKLERVMKEIRELDRVILMGLLDADCNEEVYNLESAAVEDYEDKFSAAKLSLKDVLGAEGESKNVRTFKLPKIQLKTFNGNVTEWLGFWSQFQKIHEDDTLDPSDKFQYLVQGTVAGSRARELIDSYPPCAENYPKVVAALKQRFGRTELLIEVYVRDLLKLTIDNVSHTKEKVSLSTMYDKLESHLRALESLGVASANYAAMLFPMVESSLPEALLVAWQRDPLSRRDGSTEQPPRDKLSFLMEFLRSEVEGEERVALAKAGFGVLSQGAKTKKGPPKNVTSQDALPTAAGLLSAKGNTTDSDTCAFCDKGHDTRDCIAAAKMSLQEKRAKLTEGKRCYVCLRQGHVVRNCRKKVSCLVCSKRHFPVLCPELPLHKEKESQNVTSSKDENKEVRQTLTNNTGKGDVLLQTLVVKIVGPKHEKFARILIDSGSQRSYILKRTAKEIGMKPLGQEVLIHSLFGGQKTSQSQHNLYRVQLRHPSSSFSCQINVLDQEIICGPLPRAKPGMWLQDLNEKNIWISDVSSRSSEIEVLLGADICGKLVTGRVQQVDPNLTAVETELGWTLMRCSPEGNLEPRLSEKRSAVIGTLLKGDCMLPAGKSKR